MKRPNPSTCKPNWGMPKTKSGIIKSEFNSFPSKKMLSNNKSKKPHSEPPKTKLKPNHNKNMRQIISKIQGKPSLKASNKLQSPPNSTTNKYRKKFSAFNPKSDNLIPYWIPSYKKAQIFSNHKYRIRNRN